MLVIVDEISMVTPDQLVMLDLRLQEIKEKVGIPFGGCGVLVFGDMMQLRPIQGRYICEEPKNQEFQISHEIAPKWKMFKSLILEKNHRQGRDKPYAELLNRVRTGNQTPEDLEQLRSRIREESHKDVRNADMYIGCKRKDVAERNKKYILKLKGTFITGLVAKHFHATQKKYKPQISKKDGTVATTAFQNELILKIGAKVMLIHNIDVPDMLSNGQLGTLEDTIKTTEGKIDMLVIKLKDERAGKSNMERNSSLSKKYPGCVFIERVSLQYTLSKRSGDFGSSATVIQFPVRLSFAMTSHKIQGASIPFPTKVAMDIDSVFQPAQAYVMLSRVQCMDQLVIVKKLDEEKIRVSKVAIEELRRLEETSINKNPTPWHRQDPSLLKIASLNCAGLVAHLKDIRTDEKILNANILHFQETSLPEINDSDGIQIDHFNSRFIREGKGKGIATYTKNDTNSQLLSEFKSRNLQIMKIQIRNIETISVYRSSDMSLTETIKELQNIIDTTKTTLITGDLNICLIKNDRNVISQGLQQMGFVQLVTEATHIEGGHIDHAYWLDKTGEWEKPQLERYSPYYSDHDALLLTLKKQNKRNVLLAKLKNSRK